MFFTLSVLSVFGQGVTTASLKGKVLDKDGKAINGIVTIQAINQANNSEYVTMTFSDGNYKLQGLQVGGPYKIIAVLTGYKTQEKDNVFLQLNQEAIIDFVLATDEQELEEVIVTVDALEANKTGAVTSIGLKQIQVMPTISRSQNDMTRLNPLANGTSFGGRNKLYNNFSLDGSVFNNSFGLDDATPGGQSDAQPVSMDALEQIQVSLAPFDVREGGFSGAGINAVTKSGTNDLKASLYYYTRNENMIGSKVGDLEVENFDFGTMLTGFTVGGPIIKDKLFFFVSAEAERIDALAHGFVANDGTNSGANVTSVSETDIIAVQQHLINEWGYDPGAYQGYNHKTESNKILAKLNWNINKKHKFTIRYNMLQAFKDHTPHPEAIIGRGPTSYRLPFENSSYRINNNIYSVVSELNSRFSNKLFNKVLVGYTAFRDFREPKSVAFPVIDIFDANGNLAISSGMEMFSTNNVLDQDVYQFNDNLTYYAEKHTITGGVNFEMFQFNNSFNLFYYPWHTYGLDEFLNTTSADIDYNAEVTASQQNDFAMAEVDVAQLAFYVQDEFEVSNNFNVTAGLRVDMPIYFNQIEEDTNITGFTGWKDTDGNDAKIDPSVWPSNNLMWSPRIGFNWSAKSNLKLRGGTGIFTGRIPFVWLGNQSTNSNIDPGYEFQVNDTEEGFRYPQVWKSDLALDITVGNGWFFTLEGIYGKDINAVVHRNYDMLKPTGQLSGADDRAIFAGFNESHIYASDASTTTFLDAGVIVMENVDEGYQGSLTAQVKKNFNFGVNLFAAYSYLESKDYTSIPAEIAADAFGRNPVVGDPNQSMFSYSRYGLKHRFITSASYQVEFKKNFATSIGLFYELGKGNRYSYIYNGDLNQDGIGHNDLLFVPANSSEIHFGTVDGATGVATEAADAAAQWTTLEAYINQDDYLSTRKGDYAERNGGMLPWFSQLDVSLAQDFSMDVKGKKNTLRLSVDILNFGNLINSNWGVRKMLATNAPISLSGIDSNSVPYYSVSPDLKDTFIDNTSILSKWQIQFGIRYIFN